MRRRPIEKTVMVFLTSIKIGERRASESSPSGVITISSKGYRPFVDMLTRVLADFHFENMRRGMAAEATEALAEGIHY